MHEKNTFIDSDDHNGAENSRRIGMNKLVTCCKKNCILIKNIFSKLTKYGIGNDGENKHNSRLKNYPFPYIAKFRIFSSTVDHDIAVAKPDCSRDSKGGKIFIPCQVRRSVEPTAKKNNWDNESKQRNSNCHQQAIMKSNPAIVFAHMAKLAKSKGDHIIDIREKTNLVDQSCCSVFGVKSTNINVILIGEILQINIPFLCRSFTISIIG